jgi:CheY-like chemotaxis protein
LNPAALVLDLAALGTESWRLLRDLRANENTAQITVTALTTARGPGTGPTPGANAARTKPAGPASLLRTLEEHVLRPFGEPARVLVVDDEPKTQELLEETLRSADLLPVVVSSAKQALETLARRSQRSNLMRV